MQQLSGSGGLPRPLSPLASPRIRAEGPASGAENRTRLFGGVVELVAEEEEEEGEAGTTESEEVGLEAVGARRGLIVLREGLGVGWERRSP